MKVAIISDIHDNIPNLNKVLNYLNKEKIDKLVCCGDFGSEETLVHLSNNFKGQIWVVLGNMDRGYVEYDEIKDKFENIKIYDKVGKFELENKTILIVHQPQNYESYLNDNDIQYIFYGHTHKPWQETKNSKMILCPGNVANQIYAPSFAVWDLNKDKFELIQINILK